MTAEAVTVPSVVSRVKAEPVFFQAPNRGREEFSAELLRLGLEFLHEVEAVHGFGIAGVVFQAFDEQGLASEGHFFDYERLQIRPGSVLGRGQPGGSSADDDEIFVRHSASSSQD